MFYKYAYRFTTKYLHTFRKIVFLWLSLMMTQNLPTDHIKLLNFIHKVP